MILLENRQVKRKPVKERGRKAEKRNERKKEMKTER